jgi:FkbM family methyltransferase
MELDFIEIGTSDFDTEIQNANGRTGLSVEPIQLYLDRLPTPEGVQKVCTAITNYDGEIKMFYMHPDTIKKHDFPDWLRGCNTIGVCHPIVRVNMHLRKLKQNDIITEQTVRCMTFETLCKQYNVSSCKFLKIDTEGHDPVILHSYMDYVDSGFEKIKKIKFESNEWTHPAEIQIALARLVNLGYKVKEFGYNTVVELDETRDSDKSTNESGIPVDA